MRRRLKLNISTAITAVKPKPEKPKKMTLVEQLDHELGRHDWYYMMSDDHRWWSSGSRHWDEIVALMDAVFRSEKDGLKVITEIFDKHNPNPEMFCVPGRYKEPEKYGLK